MKHRITLRRTKRGYIIEISDRYTGAILISEEIEHNAVYAMYRAHQLIFEQLGVIVAQ